MGNQINLKEKFIEMFSDENIRKLPDNAEWCKECNGIGWHDKHKGFITLCNRCEGKGYIENRICKCGNIIETYYRKQCDECDNKEWEDKCKKTRESLYNKANKIKYDDYDGMFSFDAQDRVWESDYFEEWLADLIYNGKEYPTWIFGTVKEPVLSLDIINYLFMECEDNGYEDMYSFLDYQSLEPIQEQIDEWIKEQGDLAYIYVEDQSTVVILDELIERLKKELEKDV